MKCKVTKMNKKEYSSPKVEEHILLDVLMAKYSSSLEKPEEGGEWDDFD